MAEFEKPKLRKRSLIMKKLLVGALALMAVACNAPEPKASSPIGAWKIDPAQSTLSLVTVKKGAVAESHVFKTVNGDVAPDGNAKIVVDLASIATENDDRDSRMKEFLFEVAKYPTATVTAKLDPAKFENLGVGDRRIEPVSLIVDLHGGKAQVDADVYVTRLSDDRILVETVKPIVLESEDFGFLPGLEKLKELAELSAITPAAPVAFSVVLVR